VQIVVGIDSPPLGNADCSLKIITQPNGGTVQSGQNYLMLTLPRSAITPYSSFSVSGALTTPGYEIYRWDITGATKTSDSNASTPSANGSAGIGTPYGDYITATARTRIIQMHGPSVTMQDTLPTLVLSPGNPPQTSVPVTVKSNGTVVGWYAQVFYGSGSNAYCTPSGGTLMPGQSATTTVYTPPMNQAGPYKIVVTAALPAPSLPMYHFGDPMNQTNTTAYPVYINYWGYYQGTDDPLLPARLHPRSKDSYSRAAPIRNL